MGISYFFKTLYLCSVTFKNESKMNKFGVFYGSTTGTTEDLARRIAEKLDVPSADVFDVSKLTEALVNEYDVLVLGSSTWGAGELQDDWYDGVKVLKKCDLSHKSVALFGCGDSDSYSDTFCDAIGILYEDLKDYIDFPYVMMNDANAGGYAELWHAKMVKNMIYLSLSNSVGGAVLMNNEIYYGDRMHGGEFGHMTLEINGKQCYCGRKGCADVYCNAQNLSNLTDGDLGKFFELVDTGDKKYVDEWNKYMQYLAVMINNIYNILDCDVVLGGYVGGYIEKYLDELRHLVSQRCTFVTDGSFIKPCFFKHESSAVGAALYFVDKFIEEI